MRCRSVWEIVEEADRILFPELDYLHCSLLRQKKRRTLSCAEGDSHQERGGKEYN